MQVELANFIHAFARLILLSNDNIRAGIKFAEKVTIATRLGMRQFWRKLKQNKSRFDEELTVSRTGADRREHRALKEGVK
jgi:hypothetical protein